MSMLGIAGFALMILIVALLLWGKSTPAVVFILLPIITGFVVGFTPAEMSGYIAAGVSGVATTAILFILAVLFFGAGVLIGSLLTPCWTVRLLAAAVIAAGLLLCQSL